MTFIIIMFFASLIGLIFLFIYSSFKFRTGRESLQQSLLTESDRTILRHMGKLEKVIFFLKTHIRAALISAKWLVKKAHDDFFSLIHKILWRYSNFVNGKRVMEKKTDPTFFLKQMSFSNGNERGHYR